jgi:signal transduction histidine kinase
MFVGMIAGVISAIIAFTILEQAITAIINLIIPVTAFIMLRAAERRKNYPFFFCIIIVVIFMILFPLLFFFCGGNHSGATLVFLCAIVFTSYLLEKRVLTAALIIEFSIYVSCLLVSYYRPETTAVLSSEFYHLLHVLSNFTFSCVLLAVVIMVRRRIFLAKQDEIQELNRELEALNEKLTRYDSMKNDFLATVAHEINTPLAVISASSGDTIDLLKESPLNIDEIMENQVMIDGKVKLIKSILLDLMDTAAIENGRLSLSRQPVNLRELIRNICDVQYSMLNANNNRITYDLQMDLPQIWADPRRIEQVMTNLLSNAFRHTQDGIITIKLMRTDGGSQVVSVTDNGAGMDAEMTRVVLKQYVSTSAEHWRHGIGLYICRRIVMAHGGDIWIDSEKGRGTTVSFSLSEE